MGIDIKEDKSRIWIGIAILSGIVSIALLLWFLPPRDVEAHNILHHLNFAPLLLAGLLFGSRMALWVTLFAFGAEAFNVYRTFQVSAFDAVDLLVELSIFGVAGIVAGFLSDRSRRQHRKLEQTAVELEGVYRELSQNVEKMKKAERLYAAGQLSASLAHEIRNPLAGISGAAALLKRAYATGSSSNNAEECLDIISRESQRLNKLLTNFLEFARPRAPHFRQAEVGEVIQSVAELASHATSPDVQLERSIQPGLPTIECDSEQLKQVLLNLVVNAMQATPKGGVVKIGAAKDNDRLVIAVKDQGEGMALGQTDRIFEPFFTTKENGSGLGLAISAKIVEQHGGQLRADSNPGGGMTFRVEIPLAQGVKK